MKISRILSAMLCLILIVGLAPSAFAANESYYLLTNAEVGNTSYFQDENPNFNKKTQADDPATIKCVSTNAPGWGYYMRLVNDPNSIYTLSYWYNSTNNLRHPTYVNQAYANNKYYYIEGRFDNDYGGTYSISGVFNADYTTP